MATGDVYTHDDTGPAWGATADVIGANGPVLTDQSGAPAWTTASAAQGGSYDVLTWVADEALSSDRPGWAGLPASLVCLTTAPTIRLVAGGINPPPNIQADGPLGTNTVFDMYQMCWGPDGLIYLAGVGDDNGLFVRTFDPTTGIVTTLPFHSTFGDRGAMLGIAASAAGNIYFIVNSTDDSNTTYLCKVAAGSVDQSGVSELHFFSEFFGSASAFQNLGVVTNPDGKEFVLLAHVTFKEVMYFDVTAGTLHQYIMGKEGADGLSPTNPDMGEHVAGPDGLLGEQLRGMVTTPGGEVVTGSYGNQVMRAATLTFVDDGAGGTVPQANDLHSITNHTLNTSSAGNGGDGEAAYTEGNHDPQFNGVSAVGLDGCGNYYACDFNNNSVRMIDAAGILHTIAGNGLSAFDPDATFPTTTPTLATTLTMGINASVGGALLPDPAGGLYLAMGNGIYKLEG
jgi:hypothetical protein